MTEPEKDQLAQEVSEIREAVNKLTSNNQHIKSDIGTLTQGVAELRQQVAELTAIVYPRFDTSNASVVH